MTPPTTIYRQDVDDSQFDQFKWCGRCANSNIGSTGLFLPSPRVNHAYGHNEHRLRSRYTKPSKSLKESMEMQLESIGKPPNNKFDLFQSYLKSQVTGPRWNSLLNSPQLCNITLPANTCIFNESLRNTYESRSIPPCLKTFNISPIFKCSRPSSISDDRSISLLSFLQDPRENCLAKVDCSLYSVEAGSVIVRLFPWPWQSYDMCYDSNLPPPHPPS